MNKELLRDHIEHYRKWAAEQPDKYAKDCREREERRSYFQAWTRERLLEITAEDLYSYLRRLWALRIWGNKQYVVDKIISNNALQTVRQELVELIWGGQTIAERWDRFRKEIIGIGPAMMSELLCHVHPDDYVLWNRRVYVGFDYLGVEGVPRYDYQVTGEKYVELCTVAKDIRSELQKAGLKLVDLLMVDYFVWQELQVQESLSLIGRPGATLAKESLEKAEPEKARFIHDDVRDKVADIGNWLGFRGTTEVKVAEGSKVDAIWEATIGNMGRVIYVFEVQTKGSLDSLVLNLLKSLNNPAVQGVVAVSDAVQLEKIKKHAETVSGLRDKLRYWEYEEVLQVYESLQKVNEAINSLGLVPESF